MLIPNAPEGRARTLALIDALTAELKQLRSQVIGVVPIPQPNSLPSTPTATSRVVDYLRSHPGVTRREIAKGTQLSARTVSKSLTALRDNGEACYVGVRHSKWLLTNSINLHTLGRTHQFPLAAIAGNKTKH